MWVTVLQVLGKMDHWTEWSVGQFIYEGVFVQVKQEEQIVISMMNVCFYFVICVLKPKKSKIMAYFYLLLLLL